MRAALRAPLAAAAVGAVLGLAACSGTPAPSGSTSPAPGATSGSAEASASAPAPSPTASTSPSPSLATLPARQCLTGTWALVRFVGASGQTYGTGEGGDVTVRFAAGGYTLSGAGRKPIQVTLGGATGNLTVDGRATGTERLDGSTAAFTSTSARGSGTVEAAGRRQRLSMDQVANVIGLDGKGEVACTARAMTITFPTVRLELARS